jgi:hypothetical protein
VVIPPLDARSLKQPRNQALGDHATRSSKKESRCHTREGWISSLVTQRRRVLVLSRSLSENCFKDYPDPQERSNPVFSDSLLVYSPRLRDSA